MKRLLITGGTVFVSKFTASYFVKKGYAVYVLNRNTKAQVDGVNLICADRNNLGNILKAYNFDAVIDVCAYNKNDVESLLNAINKVSDYIFISSSAVYPQTNKQPFSEEQPIGNNSIWGAYATNKVEAEEHLFSRIPNAYVIRPPYLYGPMQNLYREPFVFDCAIAKRKFYIPKDGNMKLQFFHVEDLCRVIEVILEKHPREHIFNVGNEKSVTVNEFVELCYEVVGERLEKICVTNHNNQRDYFPFYDYEYDLDITRQLKLIADTKDLKQGLKESLDWYLEHKSDVVKKHYMRFIDKNLI